MRILRALLIAAILTPIVPARVGYALCRLIGVLLWAANTRARRQVIDNLRHVQPAATWIERQRLAIRVFITVVTNYYDLLRLRSVDRDRLLDLLEVHGSEYLERALLTGRGVIILSAHIGNFNVVAQYPSTIGLEAAIIAERVQPPELFGYMARLRSALGITVIPPGREAIRPILRILRRNGVLLVAGDRAVTDQVARVSFFGEPAALPVGPVVLAMRTGATLLPAFTLRRSDRKSLVFILEPLEIVRTADREADIQENMRRVAASLERMIETDPGQWAVLQAVWGSPTPERLARSEGLGAVPQDLAEPVSSFDGKPGQHDQSP